MVDHISGDRRSAVLQSKRKATKYQILVEIAERQPAVSQQEIADIIGVTSQAVSNYLQELVDDDYVNKRGRGRYEVTKEGVDWLISETDALEAYASHVSTDVIDSVDVETAVATGTIVEGQRVSLTMRDGHLHARPGNDGDATAVALTAASGGEDVGITDFEGVVDYDLGMVTVVSVPPIQEGGSSRIDTAVVRSHVSDHDLVAVAGLEAVAVAEQLSVEPDIEFGTVEAVHEAALKGLDVFLLTVADQLSTHTSRLREDNVTYEVLDVTE